MAKLRIPLTEPIERAIVDRLAIAAGWTLIDVEGLALVFATPGTQEIVTFGTGALEISAHDPSALATALRATLPLGEPEPIEEEMVRRLPSRPRLAPHVQSRIHVIQGEPRVILNDYRSEAVAQVSLASWKTLTLADGTRDLDALALAAVKEGLYAGAGDLLQLLTPLFDAGLLVGGLEPPAPPPPVAPPDDPDARPVAPLPGYTFVCDGRGACCRSYDTVSFVRVEAMTARVLSEQRPMPLDRDDMFTPLAGPVFEEVFAVAQRDGRCVLLDDEDLCSLHSIGGPNAKPHGCRFYPAAFADDGTEVRVSVGPECACVFASVGVTDGAPLVPATAKTFGDVRYRARVVSVPDPVPLTHARGASRAELRRWSAALTEWLAADPDVDAAALAWHLAREVERGLTFVPTDRCDPPDHVTPWLETLRARARATLELHRGWRTPRDISLRVLEWIDRALAIDDAALLALPASDAKSERFYLRALAHGHRLATEGRPLSHGLRDRAIRILTARAMAHAGVIDDPAARFPLAPLEVAMRNLSLVRYSDEVSARLASAPSPPTEGTG